jgi:hypothetical protein
MADAAPKSKVIARGKSVTTPAKSTTRISKPMPLPCITILVHGVNDVGEAYDAQEQGVCRGLNARLNRSHSLDINGLTDLVPGTYRIPPTEAEEIKKESAQIKKDPDAVYYRRSEDDKTWSPVVPFYWGFRETDKGTVKNASHGQWTDRYGNRIDKNRAKEGGPFANATSNLNDMWGEGFGAKMAGMEWPVKAASDPLHDLRRAAPRHYMLLAAKRLATLIAMIRGNPLYKDTAINILAHSQGTMVTLTAHALLAADGGKFAADTLIFQDSPYSLAEANLEFLGDAYHDQQTTQSRVKSISNIVQYVWSKKAATPALAELAFPNKTGDGVAGPFWQPGAGAQQVIRKGDNARTVPYTFTERDNRGKVYLYFCPQDKTVGLLNVEGIGWEGIPDEVTASWVDNAQSMRPSIGPIEEKVAVFKTMGSGFRQRVFTSRKVDGKPVLVGDTPSIYKMSSITSWEDIKSTVGSAFSSHKVIKPGTTRNINGEELKPAIEANLAVGEDGHPGELGIGPIDASIAAAGGGIETSTKLLEPDFRDASRQGQPFTEEERAQLEDKLNGGRPASPNEDGVDTSRMRLVGPVLCSQYADGHYLRYDYKESPDQAQERWRTQKTDKNSYHSSIPANPAHAEGVTAYDLSLGMPLPIAEDDTEYMDYLRAVADWRTNWKSLLKKKKDDATIQKIFEYKAAETTAGAKKLIDDTFDYYNTGILPEVIEKNGKVEIERPPLIVSQTLSERVKNSGKKI